ncbi:PREDICTED: dolichyl-diphosphooligosaccharide--protein glycosyltransferase subunit 1 [Dufourea novaeangliae]|uniref:Dolichyl-diphosphooligosaccharide--protein glycosyltransferase subunit 1 n=1 Tax=Dufourea novaeangliae TaxID=178035 RepID=A0A154PQV6_DUFNO|nr:PREDICTED: dolichyl-diphosphooligosaccharide--protein glycosyltransferase subunit 1 [Dufourea novaeangliae]KZC13648.1 Dolichyl-diphosphooligosaccharide--protein glycosyltransferase subunit 1 [Dufourea novaeangliae]
MIRRNLITLVWIIGLFLDSHIQFLAATDVINSELILLNVEKHIDLQSQLTKVTTRLVLENGSKSQSIHNFLFALEPEQKNSLSYITAYREPVRVELKLAETEVNAHSDKTFYRIELKEPLNPRRTMSVEIEMILSHELLPHPKEITQKEKQLVKYTGNIYLYTPYNIIKQTTTVSLPSRNVESYTKFKPVSQSDSIITYGPYEKLSSFSYEELNIHFENNNKFLTVTRLERSIEISHWGNIAVEEHIDLLHTGALLKGSFSRYEYARESKSGQASIQSFDTILPAAASDIYYRDEIGNISTSHTRIKKDSVELNLRPRFPLFGGWKTRYIIGYNVPSYEYLFHSGDHYTLEMRLLDHVFDDMVVDELVLKIILPEGSKIIELSLPYPATPLPQSRHYTYLDTTGRPVIPVTKKNLVENHIQNFKLKYTFPRIRMLQEPLLVAAALYLLFLLVITYVRLDFSIDKDEISESKLRIAGQCEKILSAQDRRVTSYNDLDDQLAYLKTNKDANAFLVVVKGINQEYKSATNAITEIAQRLKGESGDVYDRVQELQKHDRTLKELYNQQQALYVDKLVPGKIGRQQFVEAEAIIAKKKEECIEKINSIVKTLQ